MNVLKVFDETTTDITKTVVKHSPVILTSVGCVGVVTTGVLAAKGTPKAMQLVALAKMRKGSELTIWEKVKVGCVAYIPAAVVGGLTIASIISSNHISTTRLETMAAAYQISETARKAYQEKVLEEVGAKKEEKIRNEVVKENIKNNPPESGKNILPEDYAKLHDLSDHLMLAYENDIRGMYFPCNAERLKMAEKTVNEQYITRGKSKCASLNDFYNLIGLPETEYGRRVGWNAKWPCRIDIYTGWLNPENQTGNYTAFGYSNEPVPDYDAYEYDEEEGYAPWECH